MQPTLVDIGVNLDHKSFQKDRNEVIQRAINAGVSRMILTGTSEKSSRAVQRLAAQYPGVLYSTVGVHPHDAQHCTEATLQAFRELAKAPEVVAIGECGLDFNRDFSPRPLQETWFDAQIQLACDLRMPLFLHERDAHQRFLAIMKNHRDRIPDAVVHCFTGERQALHAYLDAGYFIGITGWICDERRGTHLRELVKTIPLDRLMLETDCPYLTPRDLRPKPKKGRNEPAFLPHILRTVAECMGHPPNVVAEASTANARLFFRLPFTT